MKKCTRCKIEKTADKFYKSKAGKFGLHNWCKDCSKKNQKTPIYLAYLRKYRKTSTIHKIKHAELKRKYYAKDPLKDKARAKAERHAITTRKDKCETCWELEAKITTKNLEMHHPDYSIPLLVITLCRKHHTKLHGENRKRAFQ